MANSVRKEKKRLIIDIVIIVVIAVVTALVVWILTSGKTTNTVTTFEKDATGSVVCTIKGATSSNVDTDTDADKIKPFFTDKRIRDYTETVKIILTNNKMDKISYSYDGVADDDKTAERVAAQFLADQNEYLGKYGVALNIFSPSFNNVGNKVEVRLFGKAGDINTYTGKLFYISSSEYYDARNFSADLLKKMYENKGFSCELQK